MLDDGNLPSWQLLCWCQKQPCTKITLWCFLNTKSGFPGSLLSCRRYLYPRECTSLLTAISGLVFFERILLIILLRFSGDIISIFTHAFIIAILTHYAVQLIIIHKISIFRKSCLNFSKMRLSSLSYSSRVKPLLWEGGCSGRARPDG